MQKEMAIGIMKIVEQLEPRRGVQKEHSTGEVQVIKFVEVATQTEFKEEPKTAVSSTQRRKWANA